MKKNTLVIVAFDSCSAQSTASFSITIRSVFCSWCGSILYFKEFESNLKADGGRLDLEPVNTSYPFLSNGKEARGLKVLFWLWAQTWRM